MSIPEEVIEWKLVDVVLPRKIYLGGRHSRRHCLFDLLIFFGHGPL